MPRRLGLSSTTGGPSPLSRIRRHVAIETPARLAHSTSEITRSGTLLGIVEPHWLTMPAKKQKNSSPEISYINALI
jgi:hypothetical protein